MRRWRKLMVVFLPGFMALALGGASHAPGDAILPELQDLAAGNAAAGLDLYRVLGGKAGNLFFSPYSVSTALAMTYAGAREGTAKEMAGALRLTLAQDKLPAAFRGLSRELAANAARTGQRLDIANALVLTGGTVSGDYRKLLKDFYEAEIFGGGLDEINGWVKRKTEGKIEKILDQLSGNSVCVILNAVYFKGLWALTFDKGRTKNGPFRSAAGKSVTVPFMNQTSGCKLIEKGDFQALKLPYKGNGLSMAVFLPQSSDGLPELEKRLTADALRGWLKELDAAAPRTVIVAMPKFRLETDYNLVPPFKALGMKVAFESRRADFRGMGWAKGDLWIAQIRHKAFVEVSEEGTEAAAATAVEMETKSVQRPLAFRADHPFFFLIRDDASGAILFLGRLTEPAGLS